MSDTAPKVAIATACHHPGSAPLPARVCGVDTRTRLHKTLEKKGYRVVDEASADEIVEPCRVYAGDRELSLCRDGLREVETQLLLSLRKNVDGMVARHLNRKVSGWISRLLMNTWVKPNHVTLLTIVLGALAGPAVAMGTWAWGVVGASLLQLQSILDGVDGELSRLKFQGSRLGEWLDTISDDISNLSFFAGATFVAAEPWVRIAGLVGIGTFVVMQSILYYLLATVFRSGNLLVFQWHVGSKEGVLARIEWMFKRDFFCLLFLGLAIADRLDVAVLIFSAGTVILFTTLLLQLVRRGPRGRGWQTSRCHGCVEQSDNT